MTVRGTEYVAGIAQLPDGLLVIHDLERFLALEESDQLERAVGAQASERAKRQGRGAS